MNTAVNEALKRCFAEKRVVFWYDEGGKCRAEFDESEIDFYITFKLLTEMPDGGRFAYLSGSPKQYWFVDAA